MVTKRRHLLMLLLLLNGVARADSYEQFQKDVDSAQSKIDHSKQLLRYDQLDQFIAPPVNDGAATAADKAGTGHDAQGDNASAAVTSVNTDKGTIKKNGQQSASVQTPGSTGSATSGKDVSKKSTRKVGHTKPARVHAAHVKNNAGTSTADTTIYIAPSMRGNNAGAAVSNNSPDVQQPVHRAITFGIRIGREIPVELVGGASNVQQGYMKFRVTTAVTGDLQPLPVNTLLFCKPSAVLGSQRLYSSQEIRGITPGGKEFSLQGSIRGDDKQPGLLAYIVNDGKTLYRAADAGKAAFEQGVLSLTGNGVIQDAGKAAASQLVNEQQNEARAKYGQDAYVVQANAQAAVIEIEDTF